jgi:hypothetical protein
VLLIYVNQRHIWAVMLPLGIFCTHAFLFGAWIVDDAGISFAYASNLAIGNGLVAQPGLNPVEGYSNLLWILLLAPFIALRLFDPIWFPKIFALIALGAVFVWYYKTAAGHDVRSGRAVAIAGFSLAGLQSSVVIWSVSGLENGLYAALLLLLLGFMSSGRSVAAGVAAAAVAITRPEGILFSAAYPVLIFADKKLRGRDKTAACVRYGCALIPPVIAFLLFRVYYFGEMLPNTYYAKGGPTPAMLADLLHADSALIWKAGDLSVATIGIRAGGWFFASVLLVGLMLRRPIMENRAAKSIVILFTLSSVVYLVLPGDWMAEYRYATPFFLFFYLLFAYVAWFATERLRSGRIIAFICAVVVAGSLTLLIAVPRSVAFAANPVISITEVTVTARRFERLAEIAGVRRASLLIADVGGALLSSSLRIYDLGMLSDSRIARALGEGSTRRDQADFYDYVFEEAKPTFIATRAYHSWVARLDGDARFRRDYVAIVEYPDEWIQRRYGNAMWSGDFVRRDALPYRSDSVLARLRDAVKGTHYVGCSRCD